MQWLPMMTRSGARTCGVNSVTGRARRPADVGERLDGEEAVRLREGGDRAGALAGGIGDEPAVPLDERDHDELGAPEFGGDAHRHGRRHLRLPRGGRPARRRSTGATMSWKVNMAEVGKPGSTTTGLPSQTARQSGLPGFSATPWATIPGRPSRDTSR